jgi:hypothetical protein
MNTPETVDCTRCGTPTISSHAWHKVPRPRLDLPYRCRGIAGRCARCSHAERYAKRILAREAAGVKVRRQVKAASVVEDWEWLDHDRTTSRAARIRAAAPRIGMTPTALSKALSRAGIAA